MTPESKWGIWYEWGEKSGWVLGDGLAPRAWDSFEEARTAFVRFGHVAIWKQAGFTYQVKPLVGSGP